MGIYQDILSYPDTAGFALSFPSVEISLLGIKKVVATKSYEYTVEGYVIPLAADATGSTYQLVRVDSDSILKSVDFRSEAQGAGKFDLSVYYSDSTIDGTAVANQGLVVPSTGASFISGVAWAMKSSTPASAAIAAAVSGLSPVIMMVRIPIVRSCSKRSLIPPLTISLSKMTPRT